ncbi:hypothetical protein [Kitasatospora sp. MBT66]|uniref:hypothetical protein n=1 Tax=Kitasatospora sp. MBT66 TaxID=1444769 RepID=UPI0005B92A0B|nr:hypothetical protein [Kitasatospora sp. MBT66]
MVKLFGRREADDDNPAYGYGPGRRPLWTERDRDAEEIRKVLRKGGRKEFGSRDGGFAVEGTSAGDGEPFLVACTGGRDQAAELATYTELLTAAGWRVEADPDDRLSIQVWPARAAR